MSAVNLDFLPVAKAFEQLITEDVVSADFKKSLTPAPHLYRNSYIKNPFALHLRLHWMEEWDESHPEEAIMLSWFSLYAPLAMNLDELDVALRSKNMDSLVELTETVYEEVEVDHPGSTEKLTRARKDKDIFVAQRMEEFLKDRSIPLPQELSDYLAGDEGKNPGPEREGN
jgi:hypothetical protein